MTDFSKADRAVDHGVGFIDRSDRERLEIPGVDRVKFLHNLTTNDVKRLAVGEGHETFVTSPQGKTLGYGTLLACDDRILVRTDPGGLSAVLPHFQKYGVFDEVSLDDVGTRTFEFHVAGPNAEEVVRLAGGELPDEGELRHRSTTIANCPVRVVRERPTGRPGLTIVGAIADGPTVSAAIHERGLALGLVDITPDAFERLRIEAGTPVFGRDVTPDNLPQEVGRDAQAISFVKGCYLGQETVARIDALGHVNKILKGLRFGELLAPVPRGTGLEVDGKNAGAITSSAESPGEGVLLALGYVRSAQAKAGTEVRVILPDRAVAAVVSDLPMLP